MSEREIEIKFEYKRGASTFDDLVMREFYSEAGQQGQVDFTVVNINGKHKDTVDLPSVGTDPHLVYVIANTTGQKLTIRASANTKIIGVDRLLLCAAGDFAIFDPNGEHWELRKQHSSVLN